MKYYITELSQDNVSKKITDFSISEPWIRQLVIDVRVYNSYMESGHRILVTKMTL